MAQNSKSWPQSKNKAFYLFYGPDTYRSARKIRELIAAYKNKYPQSINLRHIDFSWFNDRQSTFQEFIWASPLFRERSLVVVHSLSSAQSAFEEFSNIVPEINNQEIIIFLHEEDLAPQHPLLKLAKSFGTVQYFPKLTSGKFRDFVVQLAKEKGVSLADSALDLFLTKIGRDLWLADRELEKLSAFVGARGLVTSEVVEALVPDGQEDASYSKFPFLDFVMTRRSEGAVYELLASRERGIESAELLGSIAWRLRDILKCGSINKVSYHPFFLRRLKDAKSRFWPEPEILASFREIFALEYALKQSTLDMTSALVNFLGGLTKPSNHQSRTAAVLFQEIHEA